MAKTLISGPKFFFREFYFYQLDIFQAIILCNLKEN